MDKEKSRKLKNIFSSPPKADLQKFSKLDLLDVINEKLDMLNKNILYITYKVDKISKYQATQDSSEYYVAKDKTDVVPQSDLF